MLTTSINGGRKITGSRENGLLAKTVICVFGHSFHDEDTIQDDNFHSVKANQQLASKE